MCPLNQLNKDKKEGGTDNVKYAGQHHFEKYRGSHAIGYTQSHANQEKAELIDFPLALAFTEFAEGGLGPETFREMFFVGR